MYFLSLKSEVVAGVAESGRGFAFAAVLPLTHLPAKCIYSFRPKRVLASSDSKFTKVVNIQMASVLSYLDAV